MNAKRLLEIADLNKKHAYCPECDALITEVIRLHKAIANFSSNPDDYKELHRIASRFEDHGKLNREATALFRSIDNG